MNDVKTITHSRAASALNEVGALVQRRENAEDRKYALLRCAKEIQALSAQSNVSIGNFLIAAMELLADD